LQLFKTVDCDISKDLNLDIEGLTAKVIPISWLPAGVQASYVKFQDIQMESEEGMLEGIAILGDLVEKCVGSWNIPRCMVEGTCVEDCAHEDRLHNAKGIENLGAKLPLAISQYIMDKANEDDGSIPLPSTSSSSPSEAPPSPLALVESADAE
jgi:hypothetical protein